MILDKFQLYGLENRNERCSMAIKTHMKVKFILRVFATIWLSMSIALTGCSNPSEGGSYMQISMNEAVEMMETEKDYIILDVRTRDEYETGHIPGARCFPLDDIECNAEVYIPDKDMMYLIYCRSGRRSKIAAEALVELGYTNIKEFGGIIDWPYGTE